MSKSTGVRCFVAIIHGEIEAPSETVAFCMHSLRFPRFEKKQYVSWAPRRTLDE